MNTSIRSKAIGGLACVLRWMGIGWLVLATAAILLGYAAVVIMAPDLVAGLGELRDMLSPFNIANYLGIAITLAPGLLALEGAKRLERRG